VRLGVLLLIWFIVTATSNRADLTVVVGLFVATESGIFHAGALTRCSCDPR
jgi:hypothetical protein